jgi:polar amino acid transport system substrate-binding protein
MRRTLLATTLTAAVLLAACGSDASETASNDSAADTANTEAAAPATTAASDSAADCGATITDGILTIATGEPAFPPYVIDDAPESGEGFEAAVALAVAKEMGYEGDQVTWVRTGFEEAIAPGPKSFDINLQQYTITDDRKSVVDFSDGYYTAAEAVFGLSGSAASGVTSIADLKSLKIGVASGTTSVNYVEDVIQPESGAQVFNDNSGVKQALESNQIDAAVADLPTALYMTAVELTDAAVFGQIAGSGTDQFGMLLAKDSPLTSCVNEALAAVKASGELDTITVEWMSEWSSAPIISAG